MGAKKSKAAPVAAADACEPIPTRSRKARKDPQPRPQPQTQPQTRPQPQPQTQPQPQPQPQRPVERAPLQPMAVQPTRPVPTSRCPLAATAKPPAPHTDAATKRPPFPGGQRCRRPPPPAHRLSAVLGKKTAPAPPAAARGPATTCLSLPAVAVCAAAAASLAAGTALAEARLRRTASRRPPAFARRASASASASSDAAAGVAESMRGTQAAAEQQAARLRDEVAALEELLESERRRAAATEESLRASDAAWHELERLRHAERDADLRLEKLRVASAEEGQQRKAAEVNLLRRLQGQQSVTAATVQQIARADQHWRAKTEESERHAAACEAVVAQAESSAEAWRSERDAAAWQARESQQLLLAETSRSALASNRNRMLRADVERRHHECVAEQRRAGAEESARVLASACRAVTEAGGIATASDAAVADLAARMNQGMTASDAASLLCIEQGCSGEVVDKQAAELLGAMNPDRVHVHAAKRALQRRCDVVRHAAKVASGQPPSPPNPREQAAASAARFMAHHGYAHAAAHGGVTWAHLHSI